MSSTRPYRFAEHSYVCATSQGAVFLDLRADAYLGVDAQQAAALAELVEGWPREGVASAASTASLSERQALARSLCERGLLTASNRTAPDRTVPDCATPDTSAPGATSRAQTRAVSPVTDEFVPWDQMPRANVRMHHVYTFLRALLRACWMLRCRSLYEAVLRRKARRQTASEEAASFARTGTFHHTLTCELVSIYTLLRMFTFARRGRCLLDSIVLVEFLATYGVQAEWVIGVHVRPFSAHSWVQHAQYVLNGSPAFVRHFQPILVT